MLIKNLIELNIYDENEQIIILSGDVENPIIHYKGRLCNISDEFINKSVIQIAAMGESRREKLMLNKYGWTEFWLD